eukprot:TRINITY_DN281_c1_g1_i1.p1 TRINITY_DN281_c1_g1~~TRINITY_DN281_c1_g1_i1.p1  ORF type:complete len:163 (+),score=11.39 TRINITY_DN281_c1_g1_i1:297-785(+)
MKFALVTILAIVVAANAQSCGQKERQCERLCGGADAMDFQCETNRGAIVSSCGCASLSGPLGSAPDTSELPIAPESEWCIDVQPRGQGTCEQHKEWGNCEQRWMIVGNYCRKTCFGCTCEDQKPPQFTCEQQAGWGKCRSSWMKVNRYCERTCEVCGVAPST